VIIPRNGSASILSKNEWLFLGIKETILIKNHAPKHKKFRFLGQKMAKKIAINEIRR